MEERSRAIQLIKSFSAMVGSMSLASVLYVHINQDKLFDEGLASPSASFLRNEGYTPSKVGGYGYFDCEFDTFSTRFSATDVFGKVVKGAVCKDSNENFYIDFDRKYTPKEPSH